MHEMLSVRKMLMHVYYATVVALLLSCTGFASDNLEYGVLGGADRVIDREGYALGYKAAWKTARWVMYRLTDDEVLTQVARRSEAFAPDPEIADGPQLEDYRGSGYPCRKDEGVPCKKCGG